MLTETTILGMALAIDAAIAAFTVGILDKSLEKSKRMMRFLMVSSAFGIFQALMLYLGAQGGYFLSFSKFGHVFQFIVAGFFIIIAMKLFKESFSKEEPQNVFQWGIIPLIVLAISTSLDALAAGVSLGTYPQMLLAAIEVGVITFIFCFFASLLTFVTNKLPNRMLFILAGCIFAFMGIEIFLVMMGRNIL